MGMLSAGWLQMQQVRIMPGVSQAELVGMFYMQYTIVTHISIVEFEVNTVGLIE
jgi:hypothetical protein